MSKKKIISIFIVCFILFTFLQNNNDYSDNDKTKESIVDALLIEEQNILK